MASVYDIQPWLNDAGWHAPSDGRTMVGRNWDQMCQAFVWRVCERFGTVVRDYGSATAAARASAIVSTDPNAAPAGAMHYWNIGSDGHVAVSLGNGYCAMASSRVTESWGTNVGVTSVAGYTSSIGGYYLGWAYTNGDNSVSFSDSYGGSPSTVSSSGDSYSGTDFAFGLTTEAQLALQKALAALGLYSGDIDGVFGTLSVRATQTLLVREGLLASDYNIDGIPGPLYGAALQHLADRFGYSARGGTFDGEPGSITSACLVEWANSVLSAVSVPAPTPEPNQTGTPAPIETTYYWPSEITWPVHGIDVSGHQSNADGTSKVDFAAFKAGGGAFTIIKWAGANTGELYLADGREDHLSKARAAGLKIGFYYVPNNNLDTLEQAKYLVDSLKGVLQEGDIVALDNEPLDGAPYFPPAQAEKFLDYVAKELPLTPYFYSSPSIIRGGENWGKIAKKYPLWVAAYNANDGTTTGGTIDPKKYWDDISIWQYTSVGHVPGYSANIDRNVATANAFSYGYKPVATPEVTPEPTPTPTPEPEVAPTPVEEPKKEEQKVSVTVTADQLAELNSKADEIANEEDLSKYDLTDITFWNYAGERVIKTFTMTFASLLSTTGAVVITAPDTANVFAQIGWAYIATVSGLSALTSLLVALSSFKNIYTPKKK